MALALTERGAELDRNLVRDRRGVREAIAWIPGPEREDLLTSMQQLLSSFAATGLLLQVRNCQTCRHLQAAPESGAYQCGLLDLSMRAAELRINCADHSQR